MIEHLYTHTHSRTHKHSHAYTRAHAWMRAQTRAHKPTPREKEKERDNQTCIQMSTQSNRALNLLSFLCSIVGTVLRSEKYKLEYQLRFPIENNCHRKQISVITLYATAGVRPHIITRNMWDRIKRSEPLTLRTAGLVRPSLPCTACARRSTRGRAALTDSYPLRF
ncbi:hypothetical protein EVAR_42551_1 [Eumeta japonica]|uniref:Uncharacterized protein n=1 Tax=Eumeta variegata TaxID=151549 RepID=A0A4C1WS86_EUMVA|nr:hypothetical protein EVAR_42551_1 [Eumeta japonica]